ncbi:MAG: hypothetical protein K5753_03625 [Clostridia bacterium]|nr:hypothetical protein [Clostridia bacterium]
MDGEKAKRILECVKKDDASSFGALADAEVFSVTFDRFPLLSLCYLFGARKIVKAYLDPMMKASGEIPCGRDEEADERFIKAAGKAARYFTSEKVGPLEMLAILGERKKLKKLYAVYPRAEKHLNAISRIYYTRLGENIVVKGEELILPAEPMTFSEKRRSEIAATVLLSLGVLIACVTAFATVFFGTGKGISYKVRTEGELVAALSAGGSVRLERTITVSKTLAESRAKIDGNGNTIRLKAPLFETFSGEMENLNFLLEKEYQGGGVIGKNEGKIAVVAVATDELTLGKEKEFQSLLADENAGVIDSCNVMYYLTIGGEEGGNCYFGAVCGKNTGTLNGCRSEGIVNALNADVAGIVGYNDRGGTVSDVYANAILTETSSLKEWNPNVAGIAVENAGAIYQAENAGKISSALNAPELTENDRISVAYAAGVVCVNVGSVEKCRNKGAISSAAANGFAYAGGIVAVNSIDSLYASASSVEECVSEGTVTAESESHNAYAGGIAAWNAQGCRISRTRQTEAVKAESKAENGFSFVGGIVGYNAGGAEKSVYTAAVQEHSGTVISGAICGLVYLRGGFLSDYTISLGSNAFLRKEGEPSMVSGAIVAEYGYRNLRSGTIYSQYAFEEQVKADSTSKELKTEIETYYLPLLDSGATAYDSIEKIKELDIYFE